ncbi:MAG TPA: TonB-dependent receptor [Candidatus Eisenbacteria bacterium]|jgi:hypothetical protein
MSRRSRTTRTPRPHWTSFALATLVAGAIAFGAPAPAAAAGRIQGKIVAVDTGEPIGYADVLLVPEDTTMKKVGGLTNADGTFLLMAPAGRYALQVRALSYARKRIEGIVLVDEQLLPFTAALTPEAIQQKEIVVEATARQNTDASLLATRRKASTVGDAVSAEQMRRAPDRNAGDVLRRVTGISVSDGKYVFVRGMGERYNSTEVDGVRVVSPEQNKRVVPMDLFPAALLDNIVVQKAWSADRSGEFSGGDVQVHLKDFPGKRAWSLSLSEGATGGTTFHDHLSYASGSSDVFGFGARARELPGPLNTIVRGRPISAALFRNVWSPERERTLPNGSYALTYGDELNVLGRPLGMIQSVTLSRSFDQRSEIQRFSDDGRVAKSAYDITRATESVQLGANASLNYRPSPSQVLRARGFYTNKADDEVFMFVGPDPNDGAFDRRASKLTYVERAIRYATLEGQHELKGLWHSSLDWDFTRSDARRQQPDKREATYIRVPIDASDPGTWGLATGRREYGDLKENGWGTVAKLSVPYRLAALGNGRAITGFDRQSRQRGNSYRRFDFQPKVGGQDLPPESLYVAGVTEATDARDNYTADQLVEAGFVSVDLPLGKRLRGNVGLRREFSAQNVASHDLFNPRIVVSQGHTRTTDWLTGANFTYSLAEKLNLRAAASRTLNRPDMDDLSPLPALDFVGDKIRIGNPSLRRALVTNYDLRLEAFPGLGEVFAGGVFYKRLVDPIEPALFGTNGQLGIRPENSLGGRNVGLELEARTGLGRVASCLRPFSLNSNLSLISSRIDSRQTTNRGNTAHPLVGQAPFLLNLGLTWASPGGRSEVSVMSSSVGRRLKELNQTFVNGPADGIPNLESPGITTLDATASLTPWKGARMKFAAGNLLNRAIREMEGPLEMRRYATGRTFSLSLSVGS